jgi:hypothetical protein
LKLGNDISLSRRRWYMSQESLAERIGAFASTVCRMEKGSLNTPLISHPHAKGAFERCALMAALNNIEEKVEGQIDIPVGSLISTRQGRRENPESSSSSSSCGQQYRR